MRRQQGNKPEPRRHSGTKAQWYEGTKGFPVLFWRPRLSYLALALGVPISAANAQTPTARVGDITHLQGQGRNTLIGYGLVTGLDKTGDGGGFLPTMKAVAEMMGRFGVTVESIRDVEAAKNGAVVWVEVVIDENGGREGEVFDVAVTALAAKSLAGGRLLSTPLIYHDRTVQGLFGFASGAVVADVTSPAAGRIRDGARLE